MWTRVLRVSMGKQVGSGCHFIIFLCVGSSVKHSGRIDRKLTFGPCQERVRDILRSVT